MAPLEHIGQGDFSDFPDSDRHGLPDLSRFYTSTTDGGGDGEFHSEQLLADVLLLTRQAWAGEESRYEIGDVLAMGGMGAVVRVWDRLAQRHVAMKLILRLDSEPHVARFMREARIVASLEHPNIVPVHEIGESPLGDPYFTMKLLQGEDLSLIFHRLQKFDAAAWERYPLDELLRILLKVADGVGFAHSRGILHLDLKPQNIYVGNFGEVIVLDWGLARSINSGDGTEGEGQIAEFTESDGDPDATREGTVKGTPGFMAPEQAEGRIRRLDQRTDIFSLGALLYIILALKAPIIGENARDVLRSTRRPRIVPPGKRTIRSHVPQPLEAVTMKAMAVDPADRYQSVSAFQQDIEAYLKGFPTSAQAPGIPGRVLLFLRRHLTEVAMIAASLAVTLMLVLVFMLRLSGERVSTERRDIEARLEGARAARQYELALLRKTQAEKADQQAAYYRSLADIRLAAWHFSEQRYARAAAILARIPPTQRQWEWRYLNRRVHRERLVFSLDFRPVSLNQRGQSLMATGSDGVLSWFDLTDGKLSAQMRLGTAVRAVVQSQGGQRLLVLDALNRIQVRDRASGRARCTFSRHKQPVVSMCISPDLDFAVSADRAGTIYLWDANTGGVRKTFSDQHGRVVKLCLTHDSRYLLILFNNGSVRIQDLRTGRLFRTYRAHVEAATALAVSAVSGWIASGAADGKVCLENLSARIHRKILTQTGPVRALSFSPDGKAIAAVSENGGITVWATSSGMLMRKLITRIPGVKRLFFYGNNEVVSIDQAGMVRVWPVRQTVVTRLPGRMRMVSALRLERHGRWLAAGDWAGQIRVWDAENGEAEGAVFIQGSKPLYLAFSTDAKHQETLWIIGAGARFWRWHFQSGRAPEQVKLPLERGKVSQAVLSPDGHEIAIALANGDVRIAPLSMFPVFPSVSPLSCGGEVQALALANGYLAVLSAQNELAIWALASQTRIAVFSLPVSAGGKLAISPNAQWCAVSGGGAKVYLIRIRGGGNAVAGKSVQTLFGSSEIKNFIFLPDSSRLLAGDKKGRMNLWDPQTGESVLSLAVSPAALSVVGATSNTFFAGSENTCLFMRFLAGKQ